MLWNPWSGVKCNCSPYAFYVAFIDAMSLEKITRGIRSIDFKTTTIAAVLVGQAHVMEHATRVEKLVVVFQAQSLTSKRCEIEDTARMMEKKGRGGVPHKLGDFSGHRTLRHVNASNGVSHMEILGRVSEDSSLSAQVHGIN